MEFRKAKNIKSDRNGHFLVKDTMVILDFVKIQDFFQLRMVWLKKATVSLTEKYRIGTEFQNDYGILKSILAHFWLK